MLLTWGNKQINIKLRSEVEAHSSIKAADEAVGLLDIMLPISQFFIGYLLICSLNLPEMTNNI